MIGASNVALAAGRRIVAEKKRDKRNNAGELCPRNVALAAGRRIREINTANKKIASQRDKVVDVTIGVKHQVFGFN